MSNHDILWVADTSAFHGNQFVILKPYKISL